MCSIRIEGALPGAGMVGLHREIQCTWHGFEELPPEVLFLNAVAPGCVVGVLTCL